MERSAGGKVYGDAANGYYPNLQNLAAIDTGQGRLIPGVAVDEYARDLLTWFGISSSNLDYVLPAFTSRFGGRPELGLFSTPNTSPNSPTPAPVPSVQTLPTGSAGGGGGGAPSPLFMGVLGALALTRLRQKRMARKKAEAISEAESGKDVS